MDMNPVELDAVAERLHARSCGCSLPSRDGWRELAALVVEGEITFEEALETLEAG